jgi:hypothetical protein
MEWLTTSLAIVLGVLLRIAIPIAVTIILVFIFKRLDERWKNAADSDGAATVRTINVGCWDIKRCSAEMRAQCKAYAHQDTPCWQVFREDDGMLPERCLGCDIFKHAPVPVSA